MDANDLREQLAGLAHEMWSGWMKYMFDKSGHHLATDTVTIPDDLVIRWVRQMNTPYAELPESEKKSDREEADKMLRIMSQYLYNAALGVVGVSISLKEEQPTAQVILGVDELFKPSTDWKNVPVLGDFCECEVFIPSTTSTAVVCRNCGKARRQ